MFEETIVHADGSSTRGNASEQHAKLLLTRAGRRGYRVEVTRAGGVLVSWTARQLNGDDRVVKRERSVLLAPRGPVTSCLTERTLADLDLIVQERSRYRRLEGDILCGRWRRIPPAATHRLIRRGLVDVDEDGLVWVTLAARLARLAREHRATTTQPVGWFRPADRGVASAGLNKPGRRAGLLYSPESTAHCPCGWRAFAGDRTEARRLAAGHRAEMTAQFVRDLAARDDR